MSTISQKISQQNAKEFIRTKVLAAAFNPKEKLKLWQQQKELFGPLLETSKQKKRRVQKLERFQGTYAILTFTLYT